VRQTAVVVRRCPEHAVRKRRPDVLASVCMVL
jgi:hypothetical protein